MESIAPPWVVWALLAAVFAAATALTGKVGMRGIDADVGTAVRTLVVLALVAAVLAVRGKLSLVSQLTPRQGAFLALSGLATGASWICYFRALRLGDASRVAVVDKLSVVMVALAAVWLLGERLTPSAWCGVAMVCVGAYLVAR